GLNVSELSGRLNTRPAVVDDSAPGLVFTSDKCIRCLRCVEVCRQLHGIGAITLNQTGTDCAVGFDGGRWADSDRCIQCGQCALVCPTGALAVRDQADTALDWFADPNVTTVVQFAPAVRISIAESVGAEPGTNLEGQIVAALKKLGADCVMDTLWSADVTILEEGTELIERLRRQKQAGTLHEKPDTMFTSCCPGWINHIEKSAPDMIGHISSTRSPQAIFGALAKTYLPKTLGIAPSKIRQISIMPCTAKKDEAGRDLLMHNGRRDVDLVLTVQEFADLLARSGIDLKTIEPAPFDTPLMSEGTGAAQLFATTGGVMEAALRTVCTLTGTPEAATLNYEPVRGLEDVREAEVETREFGRLRVAVVHGIRGADAILDMVRAGTSPYHFVEVMACPGGCIGGGGTVRGVTWRRTLRERQEGVYKKDGEMPIRASHMNPDVQRLYRDYLTNPGSELAHELLHCRYESRKQTPGVPSYFEIRTRLKLATVS
ncbi:MAG: iron hydrogenase small subunit, partial [Sutterella sp.]|nr:iron hydrogenase small subunit [Sutterella sp.]